MDKISDPLDSIIDFAWAGGADLFFVNNAKDELKRLRTEVEQIKAKTGEWVTEVYNANDFAVKQTNEYLEMVAKLENFQNSLENVAWAKTNDKGDLYDLRLQNNPYNDQSKIIPLFRIKNG